MERVQVVLLVEGRDDERFLRHYLDGLRTVRTIVRTLSPPPGTQSGEQYVREQFPLEVRSYRRNRRRVAETLVVMTDADALSVAARRKTLDDALRQVEQAPRSDDERIVLLIPKRNVETWVAHLSGATVDETSDYKPRHVEEFRTAATRLHEHCAVAEPTCCPRSLREGCAELGRLS